MGKEIFNKKREEDKKDYQHNKAEQKTHTYKKESSLKKKKTNEAKKSTIELLEKEKTKYAELNDKYLRLFSEFDNFRKRNIKERLELIKTASEDIIILLLPILDDFERALKSIDESNKILGNKEGISLIYNKFKSILLSKGIEAIDSKGKEFNTDFHEALTQVPAPKKNLKGKVIDEIEKGYLLNGKVIRFAKVVVGK